MTMFSMKPKFNLAEFLAVPAPAGAARSDGMRRRGMTFDRSAKTEDAPRVDAVKDTDAGDKQE